MVILMFVLQDISSDHMSLLLEYMYRGCISVKQEELQDILKSASTLQIRGRIIVRFIIHKED